MSEVEEREDNGEPDAQSDADRQSFEALLEFLKRTRGFDFTGYKRPSLQRRVARRMDAIESESYVDYLDYLEVHPEEYAELFDTILINVTSFFRDPAAWRYLDEQALPALVASREPDEDLRVWSAGCASGEEAYSLAMLLVRHMGESTLSEHVKIYATDVDESALNEARHGIYPARALKEAPADLVERCFERTDHEYTFRKDLRRALIFGRNDLVQDAPISRIDLLVCRNTLMYFNAEAQSRILARFNFALAERGVLFLGKSEMLLTHGDLFRPVDLKCRVFRKVPRATLRPAPGYFGDGGTLPTAEALIDLARLRDGAFDLAPVAQLVVDGSGRLVAVNQQARVLFGLAPSDTGRPLQDLEVSYRPVELRSAIEQAYAERRPVGLGAADWASPPGTQRRLEVSVVPLVDSEGTAHGASATFLDVTRHSELEDQLERSRRELEGAYEELQSTVEELETTNEELQSTNEELETTNEELQSTNEELETTNEELQSTNEELETMNDELRSRSVELNEANSFLEGILTSLGAAVVVVDRESIVRVWNDRADDLWGLRPYEVLGQHLLNLEIGLPVHELKSPVREALSGATDIVPIVLKATTRRGLAIECRVSAVPLSQDHGDVSGAILLIEHVDSDGAPVRSRGG